MKKLLTIILAGACTMAASAACSPKGKVVKTTFQTSREWRPTLDNRGDAVMIYGVGGNPSDKKGRSPLERRIESWREKGYQTDFMTGIAWGSYQDYLTGQWDGEWHLDEGQVRANGDTIWHGRMIPYMVPTENFVKYFKEKVITPVIDAGISNIYLEEPEFWAWGGYSESFKREWKEYYGTDWRPQDESPEATYLSNKLKYHVYYRAIEDAATFAKEYGKSKGMDIKCYVATHSLLNYAQWHIISPEASLASLPCIDGYIAQTWTGTSREPNFYNGVYKERVFETAYLEYCCAKSMVAPTGRDVWFLTDPIEDWPRDWEDYHKNYHATFTAQLLQPDINTYEIMPWPERIYEGLYRKSPDSEERIRIPKDYSTMMHVMINALQNMPVSKNQLSGSQGISVVMGNSLMFQRFPVHEGYNDPQLSNFYGQALPLVKRGVPVGITHIENVGYKKTLKDVKILLLSYSNMKPLEKSAHSDIAAWVKKGGVLVYSGTDKDPFQNVKEWWNTGECNFTAPADHLFSLMGIPQAAEEGEYTYGKGKVVIIRTDPKHYIMHKDGDEKFLATICRLYEEVSGELEFKNNFQLDRGPYKLVAVLNESVSDEPVTINGLFIDLYDPSLPICTEKTILPDTQDLLYDIAKAPKAPAILASASRPEQEEATRNGFSFTTRGPLETINVTRVLLASCPSKVTVDGAEVEINWDDTSSTLLVTYDNNPDGVKVVIKY